MDTHEHRSLLNLPAEIRLVIYDSFFALPAAEDDPVCSHRLKGGKALLTTCSQVLLEASPCFEQSMQPYLECLMQRCRRSPASLRSLGWIQANGDPLMLIRRRHEGFMLLGEWQKWPEWQKVGMEMKHLSSLADRVEARRRLMTTGDGEEGCDNDMSETKHANMGAGNNLELGDQK